MKPGELSLDGLDELEIDVGLDTVTGSDGDGLGGNDGGSPDGFWAEATL